ncbi:phosphoglucomutase (alpha-D-glucose-1,6-bisphosphate-dependent) [Dermabacter vaginalis]|uniref:phosphoglucomutase (alpha-D-glucose-1,6-bisphosphate-dependent) n=1 Tax=Dermabacter vaginalis TaxID=1630135 RepID=UPI0021A8CB55|nr:phosphoglucomutase (alpha-D-glucose-1,6-bisphosphate-dependent) [Dermabacter vaginalis]MCT2149340.1 phosphoglucomutase (alpha-D-glucose-1,6-bisphosphate-dependent) [Dermabacter vaginalis]
MVHERAGKLPLPSDLIDPSEVIDAYYSLHPDPENPDQAVSFGTSGHRGSSLDTAFNEGHIAATTQAIVEYRAGQGIRGPLFMGRDTHVLSKPAFDTALEVLVGNGVTVLIDSGDGYTPTPAVSHAILVHNRGKGASDDSRADGIVVTPSHNPPRDGGFKYNPPHGGPADTDATSWIANRANEILAGGLREVRRVSTAKAVEGAGRYDFTKTYVEDLPSVINMEAIAKAGVKIGADPLGGAAVEYWGRIAERHGLDLTVVNPEVDPTFSFMTLDADGIIRMDCSSPWAMASVLEQREKFDIATGNDTDSDRHGIVTPQGGLMNPNHYLAVAITYLFNHRPEWPSNAKIGKTLVSSSLIDRVGAKIGRDVLEVPVGFKWFVPGLLDSSVGFGGEESAGASFLRMNGDVWTTDKDGIILALLASEITAVTGKNPHEHLEDLVGEFGASAYARISAPADREAKAKLKNLSPESVTATSVAGEEITAIMTNAPSGDPIGGLKVTTENAWFAARPSGTEDIYKIYAESFKGEDHLTSVQAAAKDVVDAALSK